MNQDERNAYLAAIVESTGDAILSTGTDAVIRSWNPGAERLLGYSASEAIGRQVAFLIPPQLRTSTLDLLTRVYAGVTVAPFETERIHKQGHSVPVSLSLSAIRTSDGRITGACAILRDTTESKRIQEALRRSEAELRAAQRIGRVGSWQYVLDAHRPIWSAETYRILGADPAQPPPGPPEFAARFQPASWERLTASMHRLIGDGVPFELELETTQEPARSDGRFLAFRAEAVRDAAGRATILQGTVQDITVQRSIEEALREKSRDLEAAQSAARLGSWKWDARTGSVEWSHEFYRIFGLEPGPPAPHWKELPGISPDAIDKLEALAVRALETGEPYQLDLEIAGPVGIWVSVRGLVDRDAATGKIIALHGTVQEITERIRQARLLRELNENLEHLVAKRTEELRAVLEAAPIPIWIAHDRECRVLTGNYEADHGVMRLSQRGNSSASATPGDATSTYQIFRNGYHLQPEEMPAQVSAREGIVVPLHQLDLVFPDGRQVNLMLSSAPLFDESGNVRGSVTAGLDVTGLRDAEQLRDSILASLPDSVAVIGADGTILTANEAWNRFARENGGSPLAPNTNYLAVCRQAAAEGDAGARAALEGIEDVLAWREPSFQYEYPCATTEQERWFLMTVSPLHGPAGGAVITHTDITPRKKAEIAIQTSEATIRNLLDSSLQSVVATDAEGRIVLVNGNMQTMFGYSRDELLGHPVEILIPGGFRAQHASLRQQYFAGARSWLDAGISGRPMEGRVLEGVRKDGTTVPLEIGLSSIESSAGRLAVAFISDITERRRRERADREHAQQVRALADGLLTAQEDERRRLSIELHDTICQQLAALAIDIGALAVDARVTKPVRQRMKELQTRVTRASAETRHLAYELHPTVLDDLGLAASLRDLVGDFSKKNPQIAVELQFEPATRPMPREVASCLYRVAQESLHNVAKHAQASSVRLTLGWAAGAERGMVLEIADNGVGFDLEESKGRGGLGLIGILERARMIHATVAIDTAPGRGVRISVRVPPAAEELAETT